jgi:PAS domain S-box-containing protein/diguanylate cyclase (GGDEF)-like protein
LGIAKILEPGINLINNLKFKYKILFMFSILISIMVIGSLSFIIQYSEKSDEINKKREALLFTQKTYNCISQIQLHRGLLYGYLSGKKEFKPALIENEKSLSEVILQIQTLPYKHDRLQTISKKLETLFLSKQALYETPDKIFKEHSKIITQLIEIMQDISEKKKFATNGNFATNHMAKILNKNLIILQERTAQLRGLVTGLLENNYIISQKKAKLLSLYTEISLMHKTPMSKKMQNDMDKYYPEIAKKKDMMLYRLNNVLYIVQNTFFHKHLQQFNPKRFFQLATETIDAQTKLYHSILNQYEKELNKEESNLFRELQNVLLTLLLLTGMIVYISLAFYHSVTRSIKKLQVASKMIAKGKTKIKLHINTKDEIADALHAFNNMSQILDENISFLNSYKKAIDESSLVSKTDKHGIITYINSNFCKISGYTKEELIGSPHNILRHKDMPKSTFKTMWQTLKSGKSWHGIVKNRKKCGDYYIVDAMIMPIFNTKGEIYEYIAIRHDITELEKGKITIEKEMQKQKIDSLTKLSNRLQLIEDLAQIEKPILLYFNIDNFTSLNDFYGASRGNDVLSQIATLLQEKTKRYDCKLYRLQSDEFLLLYEEGAIELDSETLFQSLVTYVEEKTTESENDKNISVTLSGSITTYEASTEYENLLSYATIARNIAHNEHKKYLIYSHELVKSVNYEDNMLWIQKIKEALKDDRIVPFFQPIIENKSGKITKYESLVRLIEKDGKVISPYFFLDIAKNAKLYTQITKVMFDKSFAMFEDKEAIEFSINITVEDIQSREISRFIFEKIETFAYPHNIILEITESEAVTDYTKINNFITKAKELGARIAIDDFGSGYSNFDHIIKMDADFLKIDGSLIKNIAEDSESRIITEAIIAFSKKLKAKTIVEFVHNEAVYNIVREIGADYSQGFYLGEPASSLIEEKV